MKPKRTKANKDSKPKNQVDKCDKTNLKNSLQQIQKVQSLVVVSNQMLNKRHQFKLRFWEKQQIQVLTLAALSF
jgi:hypothetical protein